MLRYVVLQFNTYFKLIFLCKTKFFRVKMIKSHYRPTLFDENLEQYHRLAVP